MNANSNEEPRMAMAHECSPEPKAQMLRGYDNTAVRIQPKIPVIQLRRRNVLTEREIRSKSVLLWASATYITPLSLTPSLAKVPTMSVADI